ncbi:MAG: DMT family transporter [Nitratireductor sp.]|nr:DMT family transporter [Nitratireductor sp.]
MTKLGSLQVVGILLGLVGGLVLSFDVPVIRAAGGTPWLLLLVRSLLPIPIYLVIWKTLPALHDTPRNPLRSITWVKVGIVYGLSQICFTTSVFNTSTANLVFILAFNPLLAALLAWWWIGEKPRPVTWLAIFCTIIGVAVIVSGGLRAGTWFGDFFALAAAITLALAITLSRKSGADMSMAPGLGGLVAAGFALPLVIAHYEPPQSWTWLIGNGLVLVPLASLCLAAAPRFISAPQAAIFYLLETVLAPIWVWLFFAETITLETMIGGAIVLASISVHTLWSLRRPRPQRAEAPMPA